MIMNEQLVDKLKDIVEVVEEIGGSIGAEIKLFEDKLTDYLKEIGFSVSDTKSVHTTKTQRRPKEHYVAIILLSVEYCNLARGHLIKELNNYVLKGQSKFTATLAEELSIIKNYSTIASTPRATDEYEEVELAQRMD